MSRGIYLENTPLQEALKTWLTRLDSEGILKPLTGETIRMIDSLGRITSDCNGKI
jgi:hypothetical protein